MKLAARRLWYLLLLLLLGGVATPLRAENGNILAVATDVQGAVTVGIGGALEPLSVLGELRDGARIELAKDSRVVLVYLSSGNEFELDGPAVTELRPGAPQMRKGKPPTRRSLQLTDTAVQESLSGLAQLALVTRAPERRSGLELIGPWGTILETRPEFRWTPWTEDTRYYFELDDDHEQVVHQAVAKTNVLSLPAGRALEAGATYSWLVEIRAQPGRRISRWATFRVASAELRAKVERLRPAGNAPFATQVVYAAWLTNMDLNALAHRYWVKLAKQRPEDEVLRRMAARDGE